MALVANDFFRPVRMLGGGSTPTMEVTKATGTTWVEGAVIIATSGLAVEATDGPTTGTILGVAVEDAVSGKLSTLICPALPNVVFQGRLGTGDTGTTIASAVAYRYVKGYGVSLDTSTTWYINVADVTDDAVMIIGEVDAIGTAWGKVEFVFIDSVFNAV
jgi:hypothetical protein